MTIRILTILSISILLCSCKNSKEKREDIVQEKIKAITENLNDWNRLSSYLLKDDVINSKLGLTVNTSELKHQLRDELINKGIVSITVSKFEQCNKIEYQTKWTNYPVGTMYLTLDKCDSIQTLKGYYDSSNFIETWGIGENWVIWTDSDFM